MMLDNLLEETAKMNADGVSLKSIRDTVFSRLGRHSGGARAVAVASQAPAEGGLLA